MNIVQESEKFGSRVVEILKGFLAQTARESLSSYCACLGEEQSSTECSNAGIVRNGKTYLVSQETKLNGMESVMPAGTVINHGEKEGVKYLNMIHEIKYWQDKYFGSLSTMVA